MSHGISFDHPSAAAGNLLKVFGLSVLAGMVMAAFGMFANAVGWMQKSGMVINAMMVLSPEQMQTILLPITGFSLHVLFSGGFGVAFFLGVIVYKYLKIPGNMLFLGVLFGIFIFIVNAGIMAPLMDLHPPFWEQSTVGAVSGLAARLIYGVATAVFLQKWVVWPEFVFPAKK